MSEGETSTLRELPRNTVNLIGSCQVITSVFSVVKELVENSLDADATTVDIKLDNYGLDKIEVNDNGRGVKAADIPAMAKRHFTSKISCSEDLESLTTYGFRGEALGSLCAVSNVTITTKTPDDKLSYVYTIGPEGDVLDKKPSHSGKGTIVSSRNLFHNIPVRRQYYCNSQRRKDDLKRVEYLLMAYAVIKPDLRLTLKHGKDLVFQKTALKDVKTALQSVFGRPIVNQMLFREKCLEELQLKISAYVPKPGSDIKDMSLVSTEKTFVCVNDRPVIVNEINKILRHYYSNCHALDSFRHPVCFVSLEIASNHIDVNVDPNKTKVFFQQKAEIQNALEEILVQIYGPLDDVPSWHYTDANGNVETSKQAAKTSRGIENPVRPTISYSKRPGESDEEAPVSNNSNKSCDQSATDANTKDDTVVMEGGGEGAINSQPECLPSFSLTFHKKLSDQGQTEHSSPDCEVIAKDAKSLGQGDDPADEQVPSDGCQSLEIITSSELAETNCGQMDKGVLPVCGSDVPADGGILNDVEALLSVNRTVLAGSEDCAITFDDTGQNDKSDGTIMWIPIPAINPDDWSKGTVMEANTLLQPVKLLPPSNLDMPGKRPLSPSGGNESLSQPRRKVAKLSLPPNQATLIEMMKSQQVKTPESPFTHFSQEKHSSFVEEFPDADASAIVDKLKEAWGKLDDSDKVAYRDQCWQDTKRYEKEKTSIKKGFRVECQPSGEMKLIEKTTKDKVKRVLKKRQYGAEKVIKVPINGIRNLDSRVESEDKPLVIGPAYGEDDVWYCLLDNRLYLVNVCRLSEVVLYKKLKAEHKLPINPVNSVTLDSRVLSEHGMVVLDTLAKQSQSVGTFSQLSDERLLANGFDIKCHCDSAGNLIYEMVGICNAVPAYDVKDLNLVLDAINSNAGATLSETRTLKATYFLQGEAVRMTKQNTRKKSSSDVYALLANNLWKTDQPCLHHKPIFKELVNLADFEIDGD